MHIRSMSVLICGFLATPLAACSDDGADLEPYVAALTEDYLESGDVSEEQAHCSAENSIEAIDADLITEFGTPAEFVAANSDDFAALELGDDTLDKIAEGSVSCLGGVQWVLDQLTDAGASDEQVDCVRNSITEEEMVANFRAQVGGDDPDESVNIEISACFGE